MDEKKSKFDENLYNNIKIKKKELFFSCQDYRGSNM